MDMVPASSSASLDGDGHHGSRLASPSSGRRDRTSPFCPPTLTPLKQLDQVALPVVIALVVGVVVVLGLIAAFGLGWRRKEKEPPPAVSALDPHPGSAGTLGATSHRSRTDRPSSSWLPVMEPWPEQRNVSGGQRQLGMVSSPTLAADPGGWPQRRGGRVVAGRLQDARGQHAGR
jgi:hypothetical protein